MENLLFKTAIKWSLVAIGFNFLASIPMLIGGQAGMAFSAVLGILGILVSLAIYIIACLEFSKKRNHQASTGEIFGLVGLIFGITLVVNWVWSFIYLKYFYETPPELAEFGHDVDDMSILQMSLSALLAFVAAVGGLQLAGVWRTFQKAGKQGWEAVIPIYNYCVMAEVGKNPAWWGVLLLIPLVNIIFIIMILHDVAKAFGKDVGWTIGLIFLGFVFWPLLAWGGAKYQYGDFETPYNPDVEDHLVE